MAAPILVAGCKTSIPSTYLEDSSYVESQKIGINQHAVTKYKGDYMIVIKVSASETQPGSENPDQLYDTYESILDTEKLISRKVHKRLLIPVKQGSVYGEEEGYFIEANRKALYDSDKGMINCDANLQLYVETEDGFAELQEFEEENTEGRPYRGVVWVEDEDGVQLKKQDTDFSKAYFMLNPEEEQTSKKDNESDDNSDDDLGAESDETGSNAGASISEKKEVSLFFTCVY